MIIILRENYLLKRIRLYGVNIPEVRVSERFFGLESKVWRKHTIEGREIELVSFKDAKGNYERYFGVIYFKNRNINELIVEKELAVKI